MTKATKTKKDARSVEDRIADFLLEHGAADHVRIKKQLKLRADDRVFSAINKLIRTGRIINLRAHLSDANPRYASTRDDTYAAEIAKQDNLAPSRASQDAIRYIERNWRDVIPLRAGALDHEQYGSMQPNGDVTPFVPAVAMLMPQKAGRIAQ